VSRERGADKTVTEEIPNEFHLLDKNAWTEIKQKRGAYKGQNPVVLDSGYVYVGVEFKGKEARVYVKE
jgi:hypothetical protein